jgi:hypothetical protein
MTGGVESSGNGPYERHDEDNGEEQEASAERDETMPPEWARLRELLRHLPEPAWTQERADRIFTNILLALDRRRKRRQWALAAAGAVSVPLALVLASHIARDD